MGKLHNSDEIRRLESLSDGEAKDKRDLFLLEHLGQCPDCMRILRENKEIAFSVREMIVHEMFGVDLSGVEDAVFERIGKRPQRWWGADGLLPLTKRMWIPVTVGVCAALLFFVFLGPLSPHLEPSAVVYSLKADVSSVMILETPLSRQTVLWFEEGTSKDGQWGQVNRLEKGVVSLLGANRYTNLKEGTWRV